MNNYKNEINHKTIKKIAAGLFLSILLFSLLLVVNPAQASNGEVTDECYDRITEGNHVFKTEDHKGGCSFECNEGDYITVEVLNKGGRGKISIVGECNGARAQCVNEVRSCDKTGSYLANEAGTGECRFKVKHYNSVDKIFRCRAISSGGGWEEPPTYAFCVAHWLDEWIFDDEESQGGNVAEICYYEDNDVCVELVATFEMPDPTPWVIACGDDIGDILLYELCGLGRGVGEESLCVDT